VFCDLCCDAERNPVLAHDGGRFCLSSGTGLSLCVGGPRIDSGPGLKEGLCSLGIISCLCRFSEPVTICGRDGRRKRPAARARPVRVPKGAAAMSKEFLSDHEP